MFEFLNNLFDLGEFMPHGYCLFWQPELIWMHAISDIVIFLAYMMIPITIFILLRRKNLKLPFRWVWVFFAFFILFCGLTHLVSFFVLWQPLYYIQGVVKTLTAMISIATAILIFPVLPRVLEIISEEKSLE